MRTEDMLFQRRTICQEDGFEKNFKIYIIFALNINLFLFGIFSFFVRNSLFDIFLQCYCIFVVIINICHLLVIVRAQYPQSNKFCIGIFVFGIFGYFIKNSLF